MLCSIVKEQEEFCPLYMPQRGAQLDVESGGRLTLHQPRDASSTRYRRTDSLPQRSIPKRRDEAEVSLTSQLLVRVVGRSKLGRGLTHVVIVVRWRLAPTQHLSHSSLVSSRVTTRVPSAESPALFTTQHGTCLTFLEIAPLTVRIFSSSQTRLRRRSRRASIAP